ncbi:hypothetical protein [Nonomuraea ceibae]|uniref:hypothetical protein n=1 Tax=Nonomuraea ceibae TaxID=1935170 RepID=UPI001C5F5B95|nr:hypothetical protein [Nonomuraea ceibae]
MIAPYGDHPYLIEERTPSGRPVAVIEPHHDDLALSASGLFLTEPRPLTVITVFTRSRSAHRSVRAVHHGQAAISALRAEESRQALLPLHAGRQMLGHHDATAPYGPYNPAQLSAVWPSWPRPGW